MRAAAEPGALSAFEQVSANLYGRGHCPRTGGM